MPSRAGGAECIIAALSPSPATPMRKLSPNLLLALLLALATAGCGILYRQPIYQGNLLEKTNVEQLQEGMDKRQVLNLLGSPSIADPFHHERWDYTASQRTGRAGKVEVKNLTLWFEGETLARWEGEYFPEQDQQLATELRTKFGNLPRDKKKQGGG
jgi:outer membrane protein assembly factor BamE